MAAAELDRRVRNAVYEALVTRGRAPALADIACSLGETSARVEAALRRVADAMSIVIDEASAAVMMAKPFSAVPTRFVVRSGDRQWWANCAWDALGVAAALDADVVVSTECADCGEAAEIRVERGQVASDLQLVHFAVPAEHWWEDIFFT